MTMLLWFIISVGSLAVSIIILLGMVLWFMKEEDED